MKTWIATVLAVSVLGCVSPYQIPGTDDQFLVTKHSEVRSPFGTNGGFDFLERCKGPSRVVMFYMNADFTDCKRVSYGDLDSERDSCVGNDKLSTCVTQSYVMQHKSSQGQGGQIVNGLMNAAALGGVAAAASNAGSAVSNASSTAVNNVTVRSGYGHR